MNIKTLALILLAFCAQPVWSQTPPTAPPAAESPALATRLALRDLWVEHIFWIRSYALANQAADRQQAKVAADQVVDNATKSPTASRRFTASRRRISCSSCWPVIGAR